jgi:hypothetical protein
MVYDKPFWSDSNVIVPLYVEDCAQKSLLAEYIHVVEHSSWNNNVILKWALPEQASLGGRSMDPFPKSNKGFPVNEVANLSL